MDDGAEAKGQSAVRRAVADGILTLTIDLPPVNALGHEVRTGLMQGITAAVGDQAVRAVVIRAAGRTFPAGADIGEFGKPPRAPLLPQVLAAIEDCPKPVVAALHGQALGGGLELALAAHGRVALASARLGLPEVTLGLLPGAGGTQRLPRLIGAEQALRLVLTGRPVGAPEALALGLIDRVVEEGLDAAAREMALAMAAPRPTRERREGMRDGRAYVAAVAVARAQVAASPLPAPARIVDCVEAALLLPFAQGMAFERAAFEDLVVSPEAQALRAAFFAERRAARMPGAGAAALQVRHVMVLGAGPEGSEVARAVLAAGYSVTMADIDRPRLVAGLERIAAAQEAAVAAGRLDPAAREADWARLTPALSDAPPDPAAPPDMIVLADGHGASGVDLPLLAQLRSPGAPLVTLGRCEAQGVGLVLPPGRRLAEVLVGEATSPEAIATVLGVLKRLDRIAVQARGRGILAPVMAATAAAARHLAARAGPGPVAAALAGWNLSVQGLVAQAGAEPGGAVADVSDRLMAAMANAGFRLLGEGAALRPSDIDCALVAGLGWPRHVAGPMLWAEGRGLIVLRAELARWGSEAPDTWSPAPLVDRLVQDDIKLSALND